jgi:hypothetical protein
MRKARYFVDREQQNSARDNRPLALCVAASPQISRLATRRRPEASRSAVSIARLRAPIATREPAPVSLSARSCARRDGPFSCSSWSACVAQWRRHALWMSPAWRRHV